MNAISGEYCLKVSTVHVSTFSGEYCLDECYIRFILFFIPSANFVCGGYTVFMLSVHLSVRNVLFP